LERIGRRAFLARIGAASAVGAIAACGGTAPAATSATASAAAAATATPAPTLTKVRLGQVSVSAANAAIWSADEGGFLKKYGLDAEVVVIADSTQGVAALVSGQVPINCGISGTAVVSSVIGGSDLAFYAVTVNTFPGGIYAQPAIQSVKDLKGKRLGVSRVGTASDTGGRIVLRQNGLDPNKDVAILGIGGIPEILAAMKTGQIDAGVLSPPTTLQARDAGFRQVVDIGALGIEYAYNGVVASRAFQKQNPGLVESVVQALVEGVHRFKADPAFGKAVVAKRASLTEQPLIDETYDAFAKIYLKEPPTPTDGGIRTVLEELVSANNTKAKDALPASFYDLGVLRKLQDSGFLKQITGQ
jgi:ABC-type nitrate/sulfonate/bicarbonate transport system substrate-binding protein